MAGSGVGRPGAVVNWLVARKIVAGWLLTLPAAAAVSAVVYAIIDAARRRRRRRDRGQRRDGRSAAFLLWRANRAQPVEPEETVSEHPAFGTAAQPVAA